MTNGEKKFYPIGYYVQNDEDMKNGFIFGIIINVIIWGLIFIALLIN